LIRKDVKMLKYATIFINRSYIGGNYSDILLIVINKSSFLCTKITLIYLEGLFSSLVMFDYWLRIL